MAALPLPLSLLSLARAIRGSWLRVVAPEPGETSVGSAGFYVGSRAVLMIEQAAR